MNRIGYHDRYASRIIAPWIPAREDVVEMISDILLLGPRDVFYDLGCGDGRVVTSVAKKHQATCICIELREDLVYSALKRVKEEEVGHLVEVIQEDLVECDLSKATIVYMYLLASANRRLKPKLEAELRRGTLVLSLDFPVPSWTPAFVVELPRPWQRLLYVYVAGPSYEGSASARAEAIELARRKIRVDKVGAYSAVAAVNAM